MAGPFQPLPPGVYFNPSAEECVRDFLRPWIAGVRPGTDRIIDGVDIYSDSPAALVQGREPGFSRGFEHKWLMLTHCVRICGGKGGKARAKRDVATGGNWRVEQRSKGVAERGDDEDEPHGGDRRRTNGFYLSGGSKGKGKKDGGVKTPWLMEELTTEEDEAAAAGGWRGERIVKVFCKLYVSPRATDDEKLRIFGEDGVPVDRHGNTKTLTAVLPEQLFDAIAENIYKAQGQGPTQSPPPPAPRVLGHQQGQPAAAPPPRFLGLKQEPPAAAPTPRVLGLQQGKPAAPPPPRVQYGQAAATPAILRHHHGHAVTPRGGPAHHHGHGGPHPGYLGYQRGQAAPPQIQGISVQPQMRHVVDLYHHFQEASPVVAGYYNHQDDVLYYYSAPSFACLDPQKGEGMTHMEKKPRLSYGSPPPEPQDGGDSDKSSCVDQASTSQEQCGDTDADANKAFQEAEAVLTPPPPQEIPGTATAASPAPTCHVSATAPPESAGDPCKAAAEPMGERDIFMDLGVLTQERLVADVPDFLIHDTFNGEPPPQPGFDEFSLEDFIRDVPDFCRPPETLN